MEHWLINNLLSFGLAFMLTGMLIPQILVIAFRRKLFDGHDSRKTHLGEVPRLGGLAFVPAIIFSVLATIGLSLILDNCEMIASLPAMLVPLLFLICALMLLYLVGIADDLIGVRYSAKFLFQILAGVFMIASGVWISDLYGLAGLHELPAWFGWPVTVLAVVYVVNSINLIDGIDGLASGLAALVLLFYGVVLFLGGAYIYSLVAFGAFGSLLPFIYFNVFGKASSGKKIFMGDTGSLTIGMVIVFLAVALTRYPFAEGGLLKANPMIVAVAPLIIPLFDSARVFFHRVCRRRNPFMPDRSHIHHKLLDLGLSPSATLGVILGSALFFLVSNVLLSMVLDANVLIILDIIIWIAGNMILTAGIRRRERRIGCRLYD